MAQYTEGQRLKGSDGNIYVVQNGVPVRADSLAPQLPADPTFPYQAPKAEADVVNAQANARKNTVDANVSEATAPAVIAKTGAEAEKAEAEAAKIRSEMGKGRPALSPEAYAVAMAQANGARGLSAIIKDLEEKYKTGPGSTKGIRGVQDFFHSPGNERFDNAANAARGTVAKALGFTGGQLNSAAEAKYNLGAYIPQSDNFDGTIEDAIERLKELQQSAFTSAVSTLGGVPDANGRITPIPEGVPLNAMTVPRIIAGDMPTAAEFGAKTKGVPINPEYQRDYTAWVQQNAGDLDPVAYAAMRAEYDRKHGYAVTDPRVYLEEGERIRKQLQRGGSLNLDIPNSEDTMTFGDQFRHNLVTHPVGAAVLGAADMGGFGVPTMLEPEKMQAATENQPLMSALGNVGGAVTGTGMLGKAVGLTVGGKITPRMAAYGRMKLGRNGVTLGKEAGTDALYSAIYGMNTGQDPLESGAWGVGGTLAGRTVGKVAGGVVGGVKASDAVQGLRARNIPLTVGQAVGGVTKSIEDRAASIPLVGDIINARRVEGLEAFNREALNEAGKPIGARVEQIGREGISGLFDQVGNAYDDATRGVRVPLDDQFMADIAQARAAGQQLPPDLQVRFDKAMQNRVDPLMGGGGSRIYHGTTPEAANSIAANGFDLSKSADGTAWFTSNPNIGEVAATGKGGIVERTIDENALRLGGWSETDRFGTDELIQRGYDGLKLVDGDETTYQIFHPSKLGAPGASSDLTGDQYQQAVRGLKSYKSETTKPGFEQDYREALNGPINALRSAMTRGGGEEVVSGLGRADAAYRGIKTVEDAMGRADGAEYLFTPSQLQDAAKKTQRKYPGDRSLYDLADQGQAVLPSRIPDSGTAGRAAQMVAPTGLTGAGAGVGAYASEDDRFSGGAQGAGAGALMSALLLAGGTKGGQKAMVKALLDRPEALKTAGAIINTRRGLFGRAALPFVLSPAWTQPE